MSVTSYNNNLSDKLLSDNNSILDYLDNCKPCAAAHGGAHGGAPRPNNVATSPHDIEAALEGLTTTTNECADGVADDGAPCASKKILNGIMAFTTTVAQKATTKPPRDSELLSSELLPSELLPTAETPEADAVRVAANVLGCNSESCVITHPDIRKFIVKNNIASPRDIEKDLETRYKAQGPRDSTALLSNFNIDQTLIRWARVTPEFFPCPFAMMDFERNGDLFGEIEIPDILEGHAAADLGPEIGKVRRPFKCFGCVVNTDTSKGPGKHWVAVFVDCRPEGDEPWTIEYFNSAGNPPPKPMLRWMEKTRASLIKHTKGSRKILSVPVTDMEHQMSQTECGLYALFYIRRRIEGTPHTFFETQRIPDDAMTKFRKHVFRSGK